MAYGMLRCLSLLIIFSSLPHWTGGAQITLQNQCKSSISVHSSVTSGSITLHPNEAKSPLEPYGSSFLLWACGSGNSDCINTQNPTATVAGFNVGNDSISYMLSADNGYNFAIRIMSLSGSSCPTITCAANLHDCLDGLQIFDSSNAVVACKPPDCSESSELCLMYSTMVSHSHCKTPGSSYDPSSVSSTCPASIDFMVSFICTEGT